MNIDVTEIAKLIEDKCEAAYQKGVADTVAKLKSELGNRPAPKPARRKAKKPSGKTRNGSKSGRALEVIQKLAKADGPLDRQTVNAACEARGLDRHTAGNAVKIAISKGVLARTGELGVYARGPEVVGAVH